MGPWGRPECFRRIKWAPEEDPSVGDQLESADRLVVAGGADQFRVNRLAGKLFRVEACGIHRMNN